MSETLREKFHSDSFSFASKHECNKNKKYRLQTYPVGISSLLEKLNMTLSQVAGLLLLVTSSANAGGLLSLLSSKNDEPKEPRKPPARTSGEAIDFSKSSLGTPHANDPVEYGVDVSFPIQHKFASQNYEWLPHKYVNFPSI